MVAKDVENITEYLLNNPSFGITIKQKGQKIIINTPTLNIRTFGYAVLFGGLVYASFSVDFNFYLILFVALYTILIVFVWIDFDIMNDIHLDLRTKELLIRSKNPLKRLILFTLGKPKKYKFDGIIRLSISHKQEFEILYRYHLIEMLLLTNEKVPLFGVSTYEPARRISELISKLMSKK